MNYFKGITITTVWNTKETGDIYDPLNLGNSPASPGPENKHIFIRKHTKKNSDQNELKYFLCYRSILITLLNKMKDFGKN